MFPILDENPSRSTPWVTYLVMGGALTVFVIQLIAGQSADSLIYSLGFVPAVFFNNASLPAELILVPPAVTLLTHLLMHGSLLHLAGNLLYLWVFGNNVEEAMGHFRFLIFYALCGAAAALTYGLLQPYSDVPMIGASGAISGVLAAYLMLYPRAQILVIIPLGFFFLPAKLSAVWVLSAWFVLQMAEALLTDPGAPGIAWAAHISGFVAGMLLTWRLHRPQYPLFGKVRLIPKGTLARQRINNEPAGTRRSGRADMA